MKITNIEELSYNKFKLFLKPSWLGKLFGKKPKEIILKDTGSNYVIGDLTIYMDSEGNKTGPYSDYAYELDKWRRKKDF